MLLALRLGALLGLIDTLATGLRMPLLRGGLQEVLLRIAVTVPSWCVACALGLLAVRVSRRLLGRSPALELCLGVALASLAPLLLSAQALHAADSLGLPLNGGLVIAVASSALAGALAALLARRGGIGLVPWAATILVLLLIQLPLSGRGVSSHGQRNVILVCLDTLRADHLGTYGYERDTSPNLDRLAASGLVFEQAMSASHWTLPSHAALLTGKDPVALGESFAAFMHLGDEFEQLVGEWIWTDPRAIEQRLVDISEHMETVIQKYLRNEFEDIDAYNAAAGEIAPGRETTPAAAAATAPPGAARPSRRGAAPQ